MVHFEWKIGRAEVQNTKASIISHARSNNPFTYLLIHAFSQIIPDKISIWCQFRFIVSLLFYNNAKSIRSVLVDDSHFLIKHLFETFASRRRMQELNSFAMILTIGTENVFHCTRNESWKVFKRWLHWKQYLETWFQWF